MRRGALLVLFLIAGCARGQVQTVESSFSGPLPPPALIAVYDFAITPDQVRLDAGIGPELMRSGEPASALQLQAAQETQAALTGGLVSRLASYGLQVEHLPMGAAAPPGTLLVQGQIVSVDEGNRTRCVLIGLGAGKSSVAADAQLYYAAGRAPPRFLVAFEGSANSGRMPGAAETMGAGAAAGNLAVSAGMTAATHTGAELRRTEVAKDADKLADALARQIGGYAVNQGWIPPTAVH